MARADLVRMSGIHPQPTFDRRPCGMRESCTKFQSIGLIALYRYRILLQKKPGPACVDRENRITKRARSTDTPSNISPAISSAEKPSLVCSITACTGTRVPLITHCAETLPPSDTIGADAASAGQPVNGGRSKDDSDPPAFCRASRSSRIAKIRSMWVFLS
jgi:hypothetical protein